MQFPIRYESNKKSSRFANQIYGVESLIYFLSRLVQRRPTRGPCLVQLFSAALQLSLEIIFLEKNQQND
jgi:hypothetical protein